MSDWWNSPNYTYKPDVGAAPAAQQPPQYGKSFQQPVNSPWQGLSNMANALVAPGKNNGPSAIQRFGNWLRGSPAAPSGDAMATPPPSPMMSALFSQAPQGAGGLNSDIMPGAGGGW